MPTITQKGAGMCSMARPSSSGACVFERWWWSGLAELYTGAAEDPDALAVLVSVVTGPPGPNPDQALTEPIVIQCADYRVLRT